MLKRLLWTLLTAILVLSCVGVSAATISDMNEENTYVADDGSIYTYQDGRLFQLIDGTLYEVVTGESQSIIDVMKQKPGYEVPDPEVMG